MKNDMKKLDFNELSNISGGTTAQTYELISLMEENPKLNEELENGLIWAKGDYNGALEYALYMTFRIEPVLFETKGNSYRKYKSGSYEVTNISHNEMCEMIKNY